MNVAHGHSPGWVGRTLVELGASGGPDEAASEDGRELASVKAHPRASLLAPPRFPAEGEKDRGDRHAKPNPERDHTHIVGAAGLLGEREPADDQDRGDPVRCRSTVS